MDLESKKRKRTVLTVKQHKVLTKFFEECAFPDSEQRISLGSTLNMTPRTVQIWFQNQRQKIRSQCSDSKSSQHSEDDVAEIIENTKISPPNHIKSLKALAHAAFIEYSRKLDGSGQDDTMS